MARRKPKLDTEKEIRRLARERVGSVPPGHVIVPKTSRKKPKHKKKPADDAGE
jgi:hypothetical protein